MIDLGIVEPGSTLYIPFHTFNSAGASVLISNFAVTDIEIYKDGSTTQRSSDNGYTLLDTDGIDFDGVTGIHGFSVSLADNSDAGFWAAGSRYVVTAGPFTCDSQTINAVLATFTIGYRAAILNTTIASLSSQTSFTLTAGPAEDDALNGMWVLIHDVASAVQKGFAVVLDYTGSTKTVTLAAGTTFTAAASDNISVMGPMPLQPTVQARTLDVSTGGEAGLDWANMGGKTTTNDLSGTTVKNVTDAVTTGTISANAVSASALATDAVAEIVDALIAKVPAELTSIPAAGSTTVGNILAMIAMAILSPNTATATARTLKKRDGTSVGTATRSDNGTTYDQGAMS